MGSGPGTFLPLVAAVLAPGACLPAGPGNGLDGPAVTTLLWPLTGQPQEPLTAGSWHQPWLRERAFCRAGGPSPVGRDLNHLL
jgi:hypothetical protein